MGYGTVGGDSSGFWKKVKCKDEGGGMKDESVAWGMDDFLFEYS